VMRFEREARWSSDWFGGHPFTYPEYLQAKQFEQSIRFGISESSRLQISSQDRLLSAGYRVIEKIDDGTELIQREVRAGFDGINRTNEDILATLNWGFSEILIGVGEINSSLRQLVSLTASPARTRAYEQFSDAQDQFRQGLYEEALRSVDRAINGSGSDPGYETDFRFHFLLGTIRLGSYANSDPSVVDPKAAERSFLASARYAKSDFSLECMKSLTCAARAALVQGEFKRAIEHARSAIAAHSENNHRLYGRVTFLKQQISASHAPILQILAKSYYNLGNIQLCEECILFSIMVEPNSALLISGDMEYSSEAGAQVLDSALERSNALWSKNFKAALDLYIDQVVKVQNYRFLDLTGEYVLREEIASELKHASSAKRLSDEETILGHYEGISLITGRTGFSDKLQKSFERNASKIIERRKRNRDQEIKERDERDTMLFSLTWPTSAAIVLASLVIITGTFSIIFFWPVIILPSIIVSILSNVTAGAKRTLQRDIAIYNIEFDNQLASIKNIKWVENIF
jgi:tetratricopeptide (TPR) repeat protein